MKKTRFLALVGAGPVSRSPLVRMHAVLEHLGPVKSLSFRVASRIANAIRSGFPAADYKDFEHIRIVLISVPARFLPRIVDELASSAIDWRRKTVILCDAEHDSQALVPLASRGAATASAVLLEDFDGQRLLVEGDHAALLAVRRLLARDTRLVELRRNTKAAYLAGITFLTALSSPMLAAAGDCFRIAGLSPQMTAQVIERLTQRTLRAYLKAGRNTRAGTPALGELAALERINPDLASTYTDALRLAQRSRRRGRTRVAGA
jgi:hypothetical protein